MESVNHRANSPRHVWAGSRAEKKFGEDYERDVEKQGTKKVKRGGTREEGSVVGRLFQITRIGGGKLRGTAAE